MRVVVKYNSYIKGLKYIEKQRNRAINLKLNELINLLRADEPLGCFDHPLHKTSRCKSGITGLRELHVTGEILLIYRKFDRTLELVDIVRNHKELESKY